MHAVCVRPQALAERARHFSIAVLESVVVLGAEDAPLSFITLTSCHHRPPRSLHALSHLAPPRCVRDPACRFVFCMLLPSPARVCHLAHEDCVHRQRRQSVACRFMACIMLVWQARHVYQPLLRHTPDRYV